jgi:hypothetical protein
MLLARKEVNTTQSFVCKPIKMMNQSSSNEIVLPKKLYRLYNLFMYLLAESLEFTFVNEFFRNKRNAEIGHYGQILFNLTWTSQ